MVLAPFGWNVPAAHAVQLEAALVAEKVPGLQPVHSAAPPSDTVPGLQFRQVELAEVEVNEPGAQLVQATEPSCAVKVPAAQFEQVELPAVELKRPGAQRVHDVAPPVENEPASQGVQGA